MNELRTLLASCPLRTKIYKQISPILFDVSLRDGIQGASPESYPIYKKRDIFNRIQSEQKPQKMEIGSLVSPKVLPIMQDSLEMHKYALNNRISMYTDMYMLIPSLKQLNNAIDNGVTNFSFITSVSDEFQFKNTKKSINDTKEEFLEMKRVIDPYKHKTKLYISCINECPLIGKIDNDFIIDTILEHYLFDMFDELCLSDTCGKLKYDDFVYIVQKLLWFGIKHETISLHMHVSTENYDDLKKIMFYCFDNYINRFDVSVLGTGGCSVTMGKNTMPNMSYDLFYSVLSKYIEKELS